MAKKEFDLRVLRVDQIREKPESLRGVDTSTEEFQRFQDSIASQGIINPINVREQTDESGQKYFEIIDGLQRFTAAKNLGLASVPAQVLDKTELEVMSAQIIANIHKIETKPVEYTAHLKRILEINPTMTMLELADMVKQSITWLNNRFNLLKLIPAIKEKVDGGAINVTNAYQLAKLPADEQINFVDSAVSMPPGEFAGVVNARVKEIRAARAKGGEAKPPEFEAAPHLRTFKDIRDRREQGNVEEILTVANATTAVEGAKAVLDWVCQMDPKSVAIAKQKWEDRKRQQKEAAEKRAAEKEAKKQQTAAQVGSEVQEAAAVAS